MRYYLWLPTASYQGLTEGVADYEPSRDKDSSP